MRYSCGLTEQWCNVVKKTINNCNSRCDDKNIQFFFCRWMFTADSKTAEFPATTSASCCVAHCTVTQACSLIPPDRVDIYLPNSRMFEKKITQNCNKVKRKKGERSEKLQRKNPACWLHHAELHLFIQTYISNITLPPTHTHIHSLPVGLPCRKCWWRDPWGQWGREGGGGGVCLLLEFGTASCVGRWRGSRVFRQRSNGLQTVRITVLSHGEGARTLARPRAHALNRCCRSVVWTGNIWQTQPRRRRTERGSADESRFWSFLFQIRMNQNPKYFNYPQWNSVSNSQLSKNSVHQANSRCMQ